MVLALPRVLRDAVWGVGVCVRVCVFLFLGFGMIPHFSGVARPQVARVVAPDLFVDCRVVDITLFF